jgi:hypothetical protein
MVRGRAPVSKFITVDLVAAFLALLSAGQQLFAVDFYFRLFLIAVAFAAMSGRAGLLISDWAAPKLNPAGHLRPSVGKVAASITAILSFGVVGVAVAQFAANMTSVRAHISVRDGSEVLSVYSPYPEVEQVAVSLPVGVNCFPAVPPGAKSPQGDAMEADGAYLRRYVVSSLGYGQAFSIVCPKGAGLNIDRVSVKPSNQPMLYEADRAAVHLAIAIGGVITCTLGLAFFFWQLRQRRYVQ